MHKVPVIYSRLKTEVYFTQLNFTHDKLAKQAHIADMIKGAHLALLLHKFISFLFCIFKCSTGVGVVNLLNCFGSCAFYTESFASISLLPDVFKAQLLLLELFFLVRFN